MEDRVIILSQELSVCERAHAQLSNSLSTKTHTRTTWKTLLVYFYIYIETAYYYKLNRVDERDLSNMV